MRQELKLMITDFISVNHYLAHRAFMKGKTPMVSCYKTQKAKEFQKKFADYVITDIKHMDSEKHRQVVGVPNELILDNARLIAERGGKMQVRIPLIPGFNADEENLRATARFCADVREAVTVVQILPYHKFGTVKWDRLSRRPPVFDAEVPTEAEVDAAKAIFESFGLPVTIH